MSSQIGQTDRRQVLGFIGAGVFGALAGCSSGGSSDKYAGLDHENSEIANVEGLEHWVDRIERDGDTYTFHGGAVRKPEHNALPAEHKILIEAELLRKPEEDSWDWTVRIRSRLIL